ncbi:hypothetical protein V6N13_038147 [Hibiscus sabdariffa]
MDSERNEASHSLVSSCFRKFSKLLGTLRLPDHFNRMRAFCRYRWEDHETWHSFFAASVGVFSYLGLLSCFLESNLFRKELGRVAPIVLSSDLFGKELERVAPTVALITLLLLITLPILVIGVIVVSRWCFPPNITHALGRWGYIFRSFVEIGESLVSAFFLYKLGQWRAMDTLLVGVAFCALLLAMSMNRLSVNGCKFPNPITFMDFCLSLTFFKSKTLVPRVLITAVLCLGALLVFNYLKYRDSLTKARRRDIERDGSEMGADERRDIERAGSEMGNLNTNPSRAGLGMRTATRHAIEMGDLRAESEIRAADIEASSIEGSEGRFYSPPRFVPTQQRVRNPPRTQQRVRNPPRTEAEFEVVMDEEGRPLRFYTPPRTQQRVRNPPRIEAEFEVVLDEEGRPHRFYTPPRFPPNLIPFQLA